MDKSQRNKKNPDRKDESADGFFHLPKIRRSTGWTKYLGIRRPVSPISFMSTLVPPQTLDTQPNSGFLLVPNSSVADNPSLTDGTRGLGHTLNSGVDKSTSVLESCQDASISACVKRLNVLVEHLFVSVFLLRIRSRYETSWYN
jgi:hypothetical protein